MKYFFLFFFALTSFFSSGQELEWSNARKLKGSAVFTYVIGEAENGIYLLRYRNRFFSRQIILERYREKLGFASSRSIRLRKSRLVGVQLIDNKILLLTSKYDREQSYNELVVQEFGEDLEPLGPELSLCKSPLSDYYDKGDFEVKFSFDKSKLLVSFSGRSDKQTRIQNLYVFNRDTWEKVYDRVVDLRIKYNQYLLRDLNFDNGRDAFLMIGVKGRSKKREMEPYNSYNLYHFDTKDSLIEDFALNDTSRYVQQPEMNYNRERGELLVTGFYSYNNPKSFVGFYNLTFDPREEEIHYYLTPFHQDLIELLESERSSTDASELENMSVLEVLPVSDGGMTIIAESSSISSEEDVVNVNGIPQAMARNIYSYGDVLVMCLDSAGNAKWNYVINKNQSSMNDGGYYSSIVVANTRSNIYIIYNDQMRNNGDVLQYTINNSGEVSYKILVRRDEDYVSVIPGEARQIAYNKLLLPSNKDRRFALLKIIYPN